MPSLTKNRFPSSKTGRRQDWLIPRHLFSAQRYEGPDADERRLFYVAMSRARDWLSLSRPERITSNRVGASPYHQEIAGHDTVPPLPLPTVERITREEEEPLTMTFSELAAYRSCGFGYRLSSMLGFQPFLAPELGYGKAVQHILRAVAEHTRATGRPPDDQQLDWMFDQGFFLPAASKPAHRQLKQSARRLVARYLDGYHEDLHRVWETERPFTYAPFWNPTGKRSTAQTVGSSPATEHHDVELMRAQSDANVLKPGPWGANAQIASFKVARLRCVAGALSVVERVTTVIYMTSSNCQIDFASVRDLAPLVTTVRCGEGL